MMTKPDRQDRRARIVRRWAAYRVSRAQRQIWKQRRRRAGHEDDDDVEESAGHGDLLEEMHDDLR